jgi:hypothetical protein
MMVFLSFNIHTPRLRKTSRIRRKRVFKTDLKSFSVHPSKPSWNCFHRLVSLKSSSSQMLILCEMYSFLSLWLMGWLPSSCWKVAEIMRLGLQIDSEDWLVILKKFERSVRKSVRFESFSLRLQCRQRDKLAGIKVKWVQ